jgi:hypothetical protein
MVEILVSVEFTTWFRWSSPHQTGNPGFHSDPQGKNLSLCENAIKYTWGMPMGSINHGYSFWLSLAPLLGATRPPIKKRRELERYW